MNNILTLLADSTKRENLLGLVLAKFELEVWSAVRAAQQVDPALAKKIASALLECLQNKLEVQETLVVTDTEVVQYNFSARSDKVILRELEILRFMNLDKNKKRQVRFQEIYDYLHAENDQKPPRAVVVTNLARLIKDGVLASERKGRYYLTGSTQNYLMALLAEKLKRGL